MSLGICIYPKYLDISWYLNKSFLLCPQITNGQIRPRPHATFSGIWSGSTLFVQVCLIKYNICIFTKIMSSNLQHSRERHDLYKAKKRAHPIHIWQKARSAYTSLVQPDPATSLLSSDSTLCVGKQWWLLWLDICSLPIWMFCIR